MFYKVIPKAQKTEYKKYLSALKKSVVKRLLTYNKSRYSLRTLFFNQFLYEISTYHRKPRHYIDVSIECRVTSFRDGKGSPLTDRKCYDSLFGTASSIESCRTNSSLVH